MEFYSGISGRDSDGESRASSNNGATAWRVKREGFGFIVEARSVRGRSERADARLASGKGGSWATWRRRRCGCKGRWRRWIGLRKIGSRAREEQFGVVKVGAANWHSRGGGMGAAGRRRRPLSPRTRRQGRERERETGPGGEKEREDGGMGEPVPSVLGGGQARRVGAASLLVSHARAHGNERHGRNSDGAGGKAARKERD